MLSPINERRGNPAPDVLRTRAQTFRAWRGVAVCALLVVGVSALPVSADESVDEGDGIIYFPVDRTGEPDGEATVHYTTCPTPLAADTAATAACTGFVGTAVAGVDYMPSSGPITFPDGDGEPKRVAVVIVDDRIDEDDETFHFVIFAPVGLEIPSGDGDAVGTIRDDDPAPVLSVDSPEVGEHEGPLVFSLTLDRPSARQLAVPWQTSPSTATAGEDYTHASGVVDFTAGETVGAVVVQIVDDDIAENDETLLLVLDSIPDLSGTGTFAGVIVDDDRPEAEPTVNVVGAVVAEGSAGGAVEFAVSLGHASRTAIEVVVVTADGTAKSSGTGVAERDYVAIEQQTLVFAAGTRARTVRVAINDDDVSEESPESFYLRIVSATGAVVGSDGEAMITDDEARPQPFFSGKEPDGAIRVDEGIGTVAVPVSLSGKSDRAFAVEFGTRTLYAPRATAGVDFEDTLRSLTFRPGETSGYSTELTIIDDVDVEANEVFELWVVERGTTTGEAVVVIIVDNDLHPGISVGDSVGDEGSAMTFDVTLSASSVNEITVQWATADHDAKSDEGDYRSANGMLTFARGQTRKRISVVTLQDELAEPDERFKVELTDPTNATLADGVGYGTIEDDDPDVRCERIEGASAVESDEAIEFVIKIDKPSGKSVSMLYATADVSARNGEDYTRKTGTARIQPGQTQTSVLVALIDDEAMESSEQLRLNLSNYANLERCTPSWLPGTIFDDDSSTHALSIEGGTGNESDDTLDFVVTLEPASTDTVTVGYATRDDGATGGEDFVAQTDQLTFTAGETSKTVAVTLVEDDLAEGTETFQVVLRDPENAHLAPGGRSRAVGTIIDNDVAPMVSVEAASGTEGPSGTITFPVRLSRATGDAISVRYRMKPGTANAGADFVSASSTLTIPAGSDRASLVVSLTDNALSEPDETFTVEIFEPRNATLSQAVATGTIEDDESPPSFTQPSTYRYREGSQMEWTLSLTPESPRSEYPIELRVYNEHGTASKRDYRSFDKRFLLAAGRRSIGLQSITYISNDSVDEDDETFSAHFSIVDGHVKPDAWSVTVVIEDTNDPPSIGVSSPRGREGAAADFKLRLSASSTREITVQYATQHGTATADDFDAVQGTLVFSPGQVSKTVRVALRADGVNEPEEETFSLTLSAPTNARLTKPAPPKDWHDDFSWGGKAEGVVLDGDGEPALSIADAEATEGTSGLDFAVTMTPPNHQDVLVDYTVVAGTALEAEDYTRTATPGRLRFPPGVTRIVLPVAVVDDEVAELTETLEVRLSSPRYAVITDRPEIALARRIAVGTILDDDEIEVTVGDASGNEGETVTFTVSLTGVTDAEIVATYALSDGTALSGSDYDPTSGGPTGSLRFAAGVTSATVQVELLDDDLDEAPETFVLTLTGVTEGSARIDPDAGRAMGTINDTDVAPTVSIAEEPVAEEGGTLAFTVSLEKPSGQTVTVSYATADDTATAGDDYETGRGALSFQPGETSHTVSVAVLDDMVDEPNETLFLSLTEATNASLDVATATGTILDNDASSSVIELTAEPASLSEDGGASTVAVTATLDLNARAEATTVTVSVTGSGDVEAVDYEPVDNFEVVIAAGARSGVGTFTLTPEDDGVDEKDETLAVTGVSYLPVTETSVTLADDDQTSTSIMLTAVPSRLSENDGDTEVTVTATLDIAARTSATTVTVAVEGSGAPDAVDFADVQDFTITIPPGETSGKATFTVTPEDDLADELDETLSAEGMSDLPVTGTSVSLVDDDERSTYILLSADPARVSEGADAATVAVTATLDAGARTVETTVAVTVTGSGSNDAVDYAPVSDFEIVIGAGDTSGTGTFELEPEDDAVAESNETLTVSGTSVLDVRSATVTVVDDDRESTGIDLSAFPSQVAEGAGPTEVTVTASLDRAARQAATTVTVAVTGSGQARAVDFQAVPDFAITIPANAASGTGTFTLVPLDDAIAELDETLDVSGTSDLPVTRTDVALADDDEASSRILLSAVPSRLSENDGDTEVTVTATLDIAARTSATTVTVSVTGSGDVEAVDYEPVDNFEVVIAAGARSGVGTFTLTPEDDGVDEKDETLAVTGVSYLPVTETSVTLADDDQTSTSIMLTAVPSRLSENDGDTEVTVTATLDIAARTSATTVTVAVEGSGAPDAVDFADVQDFTITIPPGETSGKATFTVTPEDDLADELDETLSAEGMSDLPVTGTSVSLVDDDERSTYILLSADPARVSEGADAATVAVTATLDAGARTVETTVAVTVTGSGSNDAVDYAPVSDFEIVIGAGDTSGTGTFELEPEDDAVAESNETLTVSGTSVLDVRSATVTVVDDDAESTGIDLSAFPSQVAEGAGPTEVKVTASLDRAARQAATTVTVAVTGSGQARAVDFQAVPDFAITIPANAASGTGTFTLVALDDAIAELDETLDVSGTSDLPVTRTDVALADDDEASSRILLSAVPSRLSENDGDTEVTVTATLDIAARTSATTVTVAVEGSGAPDAVDFADVQDFTITIPPGETSGKATFTVTPEDDLADELDETLSAEGMSDLPVTGTSVSLVDDDERSTYILLSADPARVSEGADAATVAVTATLDAGARTVETTVAVTVTGSGSNDAVDYAPVSDFEIVIGAGDTSGTGTFELEPEDDAVAESNETLTVSGTSVLDVRSATVTVVDDDAESTGIDLSAFPSQVAEGAGPTEVKVTASLDRAARQAATTVTVAVTGSGQARAVDFQAVPDFAITIPANAASGTGTFTLVALDDAIAELDETLDVSGTSDLPVTRTDVALADDDEASSRILLSAVPGRVSEGDGATRVTVTATVDRARRQQETTVAVSVSGSGDADAVDFVSVPDFAITIPANAASGTGTFMLTPVDDAIAELDETLDVSGTSDLPVTRTDVTLADDDEASSRILLSAVPGRVSEGAGATPVTVTATLDRARRQQETTVAVSVTGSGDAGAVDFVSVPGFAITIPANAASGTGTFTLTPVDDAIAELDETLDVSGTSDLPVTRTRVTLADDDEASSRILLSAVPGRVSEGAGATRVTVTATLDRARRQQETTVAVSVSGSGDAGAADFVSVPDFRITIPANAASGTGTFTLTPVDDAIAELDETLDVSGRSDLPVTRTNVTLADDDEASSRIRLSADPARVSEGDGPVAVAVTRPWTAAAPGGDDRGRVGDGQRRCGRGGLRVGSGLPDHHSRERGERHGHVHPDAGGRPDRRGGRGADGIRRLRSTGELGDHGTAGRRRGVVAHPAVGRSGAGVRGRRPGGGGGDRVPGPWRAPGGDDRGRVGDGQRRCGRGGLRVGCGLRDHHSRERPEWHRHVHVDTGGRPDRRGGRGADGIRRLRSTGELGDHGTAGRRRGVDAHPAVGRSGAGVRGRRLGGGGGDSVPGPRSAPGGDDRGRVGVGQRQSRGGGLRRGCGLPDHHRGERPEWHRHVHVDTGGRRRGGGGRDAGVDGRIGPAGHAGIGGFGGRRRDGEPRAVDRRCRGGGGRGRTTVRGDAGRPERGGSDGGLCDGGPGGVPGSGRRGGNRLRERGGDADVRARRGVANDRGIGYRRQRGRAGRNVRACAGRPARRDAWPRVGAGHDPG